MERDGYLVYCECTAGLNESQCEKQGDETCIYTCTCGIKSQFLFGPPAPVLVRLWDPAGQDIPVPGMGREQSPEPPPSGS